MSGIFLFCSFSRDRDESKDFMCNLVATRTACTLCARLPTALFTVMPSR